MKTFCQSLLCFSSLLLVLFSSSTLDADDRVRVQGTVVDDETGAPLTEIMIQAGKIDPKDPKKITWGYSESRVRSKTGRFSTSVRWAQGWTARIVVDGYLPQPVITKAPAVGETQLEVVIRLKKGKPVSGTIVDHLGKPVAGAKVFAVSARGLNLYDGQARDRYGEGKIDNGAKYVETDQQGKFKIHAGGSSSLAICSDTVDAYAQKIDPSNPKPLKIRLPEPTIVKITYDIPGAGPETKIFYQFLAYLSEGYKNISSTREIKVTNGQTLVLKSLTPGKYQFSRNKMHHYGSVGRGVMLDRTFIEIKPGQTHEIKFVRQNGKRLEGVVRFPKVHELAGVILSVQSVDQVPQPWSKYKGHIVYSSHLIAGRPQATIKESEAAFKTEMLAPGKYKVRVVAYKRMTKDEMRFSGLRAPNYDVTTKVITVTKAGAPNMMIINLDQSPAKK